MKIETKKEVKTCGNCFWWPLITGHYNPCILSKNDKFTYSDDTYSKHSPEDLDAFEAYKIAGIKPSNE